MEEDKDQGPGWEALSDIGKRRNVLESLIKTQVSVGTISVGLLWGWYILCFIRGPLLRFYFDFQGINVGVMETRDIYWDRWGGRILSWMEIFANRRGVIAASASASLIQSKYCPPPSQSHHQVPDDVWLLCHHQICSYSWFQGYDIIYSVACGTRSIYHDLTM